MNHRSVRSAKPDCKNAKWTIYVGLEMRGSQVALDHMLTSMMLGGRIAMLGIPPRKSAVDRSSIVLKSTRLKPFTGGRLLKMV
jgi:threonine 3-dehydrogenase